MKKPPSRKYHSADQAAAPQFESLETRQLLAASVVDPSTVELTTAEVQSIIAHAASQARPGQVITVSDRDGHILGMYEVAGLRGPADQKATTREFRYIKSVDNAVTAAFFESSQDAFSTRTARFIIQDHFPQPVQNSPGGPLYGVEFSSQPTSDINPRTALTISGDPGGIPLFKNGVPVGGIGVSGDGSDAAPRADLVLKDRFGKIDPDYNGHVFNGTETSDFDESVALAGAQGFMASAAIRADQILLDGLRAPFTASPVAKGKPVRSFSTLVNSGAGGLVQFLGHFTSSTVMTGFHDFAETIFRGFTGQIRRAIHGGQDNNAAVPSLTKREVSGIIGNAAKEASIIRAAIREPFGVAAKVVITVVDTLGNVLGAFSLTDTTNFSYDVAVQKARTAAFFSSNTAAFSTRAVGFLSQGFNPPGISKNAPGPLFHIQNDLSGVDPFTQAIQFIKSNQVGSTVQNGITIFPGGFPLYKDGKLVGGIGISGDGVDQDDIIAYAGTRGFRPSSAIQSDNLSSNSIAASLLAVRDKFALLGVQQPLLDTLTSDANAGFGSVRLPYVKFPRNPEL